MTTTTETPFYYCHECETATLHKDGQCVECAHELTKERIAWSRFWRKVVTFVIAGVSLVAIMWAMAQSWSGDDMVRAGLASLVSAIGIWFANSMKAEEKIREGGK